MKNIKSILSILFTGIILMSLGCNNSKEATQKNDPTDQAMNNGEKVEVPDLSIFDFYAVANDSTWLLTVQYGEKISFIDKKNNINYHSDSNDKQVAGGADVVIIQSKKEDYLVQVNIGLEDCQGKGKQVNILVTNLKDDKTIDYAGCGVYRGSPRLHDIWVLESIDGDELSAEQFPKELPHLEFNLKKQSMSGFAGCNQVNGKLRFEYSKMIIEPIVSTRMYCKGASRIEDKILNILNAKPIYNFYDLRLYIETSEGSLVFKKVD